MSVLQPAQPLLDWSFPLFRVGRIAVRAHWTLLAFMLFEVIRLLHAGMPTWSVVPIVGIILGSVLLHEFGHAFAARLVGGDCRRIVLWLLGGLAECERPFRPWPVAVVAAAGPAMNAAIYAGCELTLRWWRPDHVGHGLDWVEIVAYASWLNFFLMWFNLLPGIPLDGSRVLTALVWTVFGLKAALRTLLVFSYPIALGLFLLACYQGSMLWLFLSLWMFSTTVQEHSALRQGWSTQGFDPAYGSAPSPFARWLSRRRRHRRTRLEAKAATEREAVDDLLAKVSANGLASLTKRERSALEAYSKRERHRLGRD